jgi:hypothetical protein
MGAKKDGFGHEKPNEGETNDWITPKWIIDAFGKYAKDGGMYFDLDPCISITQPWPTAKNGYNETQNGLLQDWYGMVYCNPPYGANVGTWAKLMAKHGNGIMLIFARIETSTWFDEIFTTASGFLFPKGRIAFYEFECECGLARTEHTDKKGCGDFRNTGKAVRGHEAGAPSALVSWGFEARKTLIEICDNGMVDDRGILRYSAFLDRAFTPGRAGGEKCKPK